MLIAWAVLITMVCALIILATVRKYIARNEDDMLHVRDSESGVVVKQGRIANTLRAIDTWGKAITVAGIIYGVALLGYYLYLGWQQSQILVTK